MDRCSLGRPGECGGLHRTRLRRVRPRFSLRIRDAARSLGEFAERGRIVPEFNQPSIRELIVGRYRLIFVIADDVVTILALIHGARDLTPLWERENRGGL